AQRGAADGAARAEAGGAGRDRFRPRHRRAAHRRRRREPPARARAFDDRHHALPAPARLHRARQGARALGRSHRALGWARAGARARSARLCVDLRAEAGRCGSRDAGSLAGWGRTMSDVDTWLATFRTQAASLPGAGLPWLAEIRRRAVERFADEGWPTHRMENYRHTSLAFLGQQRYVVPAAASRSGQAPHAMLEQLRADDASGHWLVFVDGAFAASLSSIGALPSGAQLGALSEVLARSPERVQ